jgi:hypothetical protein
MLTLEDCLELLDEINWDPPVDSTGSTHGVVNTWDRRFISDVTYHVREGKALSTAQGELAKKLITRYRSALEITGVAAVDLDTMLASPAYRLPPFASTSLPREVRWAGDNYLVFRCKYNASIKDELKKLANVPNARTTVSKFNHAHKLWVVEVVSSNLEQVMDFIKRHRFGFDADVENYFLEAVNSRNQRSSVEIVDGQIKIIIRNDALLGHLVTDFLSLESANV